MGYKYQEEYIEKGKEILNKQLTEAWNRRAEKRGHWIDMGDHEQCSECKATRLKEFQSYYGNVSRWEKTNFCPNCGADMRDVPDTDVGETVKYQSSSALRPCAPKAIKG